MIKKTFQKLLFSIVVFTCTLFSQAQVTIGSSNAPLNSALLDLKEDPSTNTVTAKKGFVMPRVSLSALTSFAPLTLGTGEALTDYTGTTVFNINETSSLSKGIYVWDGAKWGPVGDKSNTAPNHFYLPAFNLDINSTGNKTIDLYQDVYLRQFGGSGNNYVVSTSGNAPTIHTVSQLTFAVVDNQTGGAVNIQSIDASGKMNYVVSGIPDEDSYVNILCIVNPCQAGQPAIDHFYLPAFKLNTSTTGNKTIDLYQDVYLRQFGGSGNNYVISPPANQPTIYTASQLSFVIIDNQTDNKITVSSINANGVMNYTVSDTPPEGSYINILCVVK